MDDFEWDAQKAALNLRKHGVDIADATGALQDTWALTIPDPFSEGEERFVTLLHEPRMGLSAHQVGMTGGILIVVMGMAWGHADLRATKARVAETLLLAGPFGIALSSVGAAVFGTSRATPIAGAGFAAARWQEISVSIVLMLGSIATLIAVFLLLVGFLRHRRAG